MKVPQIAPLQGCSPLGVAVCQINAVSPFRCNRQAAITRTTGRAFIKLCKQCDAKHGATIGTVAR